MISVLVLSRASLLFLLSATIPAATQAQTRPGGAADASRADATYRADVTECEFLRGVSRDVCLAEAAGKAGVAAAERKVEQHPGAANRQAESLATAESSYGISRAKCGDSSDAERPACLQAAESDRRAARATAQVLREMADEGSPSRRGMKRDATRAGKSPAKPMKSSRPERKRTAGP